MAFTYGSGGAPRNDVFFAGEDINAAAVVSGFRLKDGKMDLSCRAVLLDAQSNVVADLGKEKSDFEVSFLPAMTTLRPAFRLDPSSSPGTYSVQLEVRDELSGAQVTEKLPLTVRDPKEFHARGVYMTYDRTGWVVSPGVFTAGQVIYLHYSFAGYAKSDGRYNVSHSLSILDASGRRTGTEIQSTPGRVLRFGPDEPVRANIQLIANAPGRFKLRLKLHDLIADRQFERDIPIRVYPNLE